MGAFVRFISAVLVISSITFSSFAVSPDTEYVGALWVGQSDGVLKIATADGRVLFEIESDTDVETVSVDEVHGKLWIYGCNRLLAYGFDGSLLTSVPAVIGEETDKEHDKRGDQKKHKKTPSCHGKKHGKENHALLESSDDGFVWLATRGLMARYAENGSVTTNFEIDEDSHAIAWDANSQLIWVASDRKLTAYDVTGVITSVITDDLDEIEDISYDPYLHGLWVIDEESLSFYDQDGNRKHVYPFDDLKHVAADRKGRIWVAGKRHLMLVDQSGAVQFEIRPLFGKHGKEILDIVADPANQSVWVSGKKKIAHVTADAELKETLQFDKHVTAIDVYYDTIPPVLKFISPQMDTITNDNQPAIRLEYSDTGIGVDDSTLEIMLDDAQLDVNCTANTGILDCIPVNPLPDGWLSLQATVKDYAGNQSEPDYLGFTVDTIPPVVTLNEITDGIYTNKQNLVLSGQVNEIAKLLLADQPIPLGVNNTFAQPLDLQEGANTLSITATDLAGNVSVLNITIFLDTIPPAPVDTNSIQIGAIQNGQATLSIAAQNLEPGSVLILTNRRTGEIYRVKVDGSATLTVTVNALPGDRFDIVVEDRATNRSEKRTSIVTDGLPPEPTEVATPLPTTEIPPFSESIRFLYESSDPIQRDADVTVFDDKALAVVSGTVKDRENVPVSGVRVSVVGHPEYGWTLTRVDGSFDLAVNGGGMVLLNYEKESYLPVQRRVDTYWNDFTVAPDVVLIPYDNNVTVIDLLDTQVPRVASGSPVEDEDGTRQAHVWFPTGVAARMQLRDGSYQQLNQLSVRATEYTIGDTGPNAMPGDLPTSSGYTYAVELSIDEAVRAGATRVEFTKPVSFYLDNFLNFPVGVAVPAGWYDRKIGAWVPSDDGIVLQVTTIVNGLAQIDMDGDGLPENNTLLNQYGIDIEEQQVIASLYTPGSSFWRVRINHFTPWDYNWPYGPPLDAVPPPDQDETDKNPQTEKGQDECSGCVIQPQSQSLGEEIPITNTRIRWFTIPNHSETDLLT